VRISRFCWFLGLALSASPAWGLEDSRPPLERRWLAGFGIARSYSPAEEDVRFVQATVGVMQNRDLFFPYPPAKNLWYRYEISGGPTLAPADNSLGSGNVLAQLYFGEKAFARPFAAAGIGLIYLGFRVRGQDLNFLFNPQAAVGMDLGDTVFFMLRLHHVSNGGTAPGNTGINSTLLSTGVMF
jgi:hypothetical protein